MADYPEEPLTVDAHCDSLILRADRGDPIDLSLPDSAYQVDLARVREGGVHCLFTMVGDDHFELSSRLIDAAHEMARLHPADFALCGTAGEVREAAAAARIALVPTIEGQKMFAEDVRHLRNWHRLGVRIATLTHGGGKRPELQHSPSYFGYITESERDTLRRQSKGLTPFAREAIGEMARLDMALDLAHANDTAFWEVMEHAECRICYTHGACYALSPHARCLTDEMMAALAERGGVMGIAFYKEFLDREQADLDRLCDHVLHALDVMGPDHVGIGSDFDGTPQQWRPVPEDVSGVRGLLQALSRRGVGEKTLRKFAGENFLRMLPQ